MKKSLILIAVILLAVFFSVPGVTLGRGSKKSTPAPVADTSDRITALHLTSITVTIYATHQSKEYKVAPATKITVNGQPGALSSLATGMDVTVTTAPDGVTAATIDAKSPGKK
jgi:hypothetical protein